MKTILLIILATLSINAADVVTITSDGKAIKNGATYNNAGDALKNGDITVAQFQAAFIAMLVETEAEKNEAKAAQAEAEQKLKALITGAKEAITKATSEQRMAAAAKLLEAAEQSAAEKRAAEIAAQIAALQAEKAKLEE